jgi:hypothetical protein
MAKNSIAKLSINFGVNTAALNKGMKAAGDRIQKFSQGVGKVTKVLGVFGSALAVGGAIIALRGLTKEAFKTIDANAKLADALGISTQALAGFQLQAELSGASAEGLNNGIREMQRRLGEARAGLKAPTDALAQLGLTIGDLSGDAERDFRTIADRIASIEDPTRRATAAYGIFGRQGRDLANMLMQGSAGMDEAARMAEELGIAINRVDSRSIEQANDSMLLMRKALQGIGNTIAVTIAPFVEVIANKLTEGIKSANSELKSTQNAVKVIGDSLSFVYRAALLVKGAFQAVMLVGNEIGFAFVAMAEGVLRLINLIPGIDLSGAIEEAKALRIEYREAGDALAESIGDAFSTAFGENPLENFMDDVADAAQRAADSVSELNTAFEFDVSALEAAENSMRELESFARRIFDQTRTAQEKFDIQIGKLAEAFEAGLIDEDTYNRALDQAKSELAKALEEPLAKAEQSRESQFLQVDLSRMALGSSVGRLDPNQFERKQTEKLTAIADVLDRTYRRQFQGA